MSLEVAAMLFRKAETLMQLFLAWDGFLDFDLLNLKGDRNAIWGVVVSITWRLEDIGRLWQNSGKSPESDKSSGSDGVFPTRAESGRDRRDVGLP